jgi:hypothetical protein
VADNLLEEPVCTVEVRNHILNPAEADVHITFTPQDLIENIEPHGRLMGPRCQFATTVEVAYPLQPLPRQIHNEQSVTGHVLIPEPNLWEPETPFVYAGRVELRQYGHCYYALELTIGLRHLQLRGSRLRCNGRLLSVHGVRCSKLSASLALELRRAGCNTLLVPVAPETASIWGLADRFGFLVLGQLAADWQSLRQAQLLTTHPSCMGWLLPREEWEPTLRLRRRSEHFIGSEWGPNGINDVRRGLHYLVCSEDFLPEMDEIHLPKLVEVDAPFPARNDTVEDPAASGILGRIYSRLPG